jgi:hypothetical protein
VLTHLVWWVEGTGSSLGGGSGPLPHGRLGSTRPQRPQQRPGGVGVACRLQPLEALQRPLGFGDGNLRRALRQRTRQLKPRPGKLHRQLGQGEPLECLVQAGARISLPAGDRDLPLRERSDRSEIWATLCLGDATQAPGDPLCIVEVSLLEVDVDQEREQRTHHARLADRGNLTVQTLGGPLEQLPRQRRVTLGQVQGGQRPDGVRVLLETL